MRATADDAVWARNPRVLHRRAASGVVLLPPERTDPVLVTGPGVAIWELLDTPIALGEAAELLASAYAEDLAVVSRDLARLLDELHRLGAVRRVPV